jgi:hypothetical protein
MIYIVYEKISVGKNTKKLVTNVSKTVECLILGVEGKNKQ